MRTKTLVIVGSAIVLLAAGAANAQMGSAEMDGQMMEDQLFPPNARPGECYTRLFVPPTYETVSQEMLVKEASETVEIVPATYETVDETVLVQAASTRLEIVPAEFEWVEETVMVKPERKRIVDVPAQYETTTEQLLDTPAHTVWKRGEGPIEQVDNSTGEIMCLIEVPATYKTVSKRMIKSAATTREEVIPAEYTTVRKKVVSRPPSTREITIPAEYGTVAVTKLVQATEVRRHPVVAEYRTVTSRNKVTEGRMEWRSVLCETNTTPDIVRGIQRALSGAGYDPGSIDGHIGVETLAAVRSYQQANGLPVGGITIETLRALGL